jgi:NADH-quinone oxidoreductase subunit N
MLAYSSIAHVGYMLVGIVAGGATGAGAVLFYLLAYTFTTAGTFGVIALCARTADDEPVEVKDYAGLARRNPLLALVLSLFLLSLVGIPPTAGFFGKYLVILAAVQSNNPWVVWLAVLAVLNAAAAAFYYLRVVVYMFMRELPRGTAPSQSQLFKGFGAREAGLVVAALGTVLFGVYPIPLLDIVRQAAHALSG